MAVASLAVAGRNSAVGDGSVRVSTMKGSAAETTLLNDMTSSREGRMFKIRESAKDEVRYIELQCIDSVPACGSKTLLACPARR